MLSKLSLLNSVRKGLNEGLKDYVAQNNENKSSSSAYPNNLGSGSGSSGNVNYTANVDKPSGTFSTFTQAGKKFLDEAIPELTADIKKFQQKKYSTDSTPHDNNQLEQYTNPLPPPSISQINMGQTTGFISNNYSNANHNTHVVPYFPPPPNSAHNNTYTQSYHDITPPPPRLPQHSSGVSSQHQQLHPSLIQISQNEQKLNNLISEFASLNHSVN